MTLGRAPVLVQVALLLPFTACAWSSVETTPLRGRTPSAVLVLPPVAIGSARPRDLGSLGFGADRALAARGYRALPLGPGYDLAKRYGQAGPDEDPVAALQRLHFQAGIDAVLFVEVTDFVSDGERRLDAAHWDLTWRLVSTVDGGEVWRHREQGQWRRIDEPVSQQRPVSEEPPPVQVGQTGMRPFSSERELIAALHRAAMLRLPEFDR